jgi:hypothetical protein
VIHGRREFVNLELGGSKQKRENAHRVVHQSSTRGHHIFVIHE